MSGALEKRDYIGLSKLCSIDQTSDTTKASPFDEKTSKGLNLKATELRLGLPGSESSETERVLFVNDDDDGNYPFGITKNFVSGAKRVFFDATNGGSREWVLPKNGGSMMGSLKYVASLSSSVLGDYKKLQRSAVSKQGNVAHTPSKEQVVGWPPIRSFRKNSMVISPRKTNDNEACKVEPGCLYIKVSMDGAPYLRKVDLKNYSGYVELSSALQKMFNGFVIGQNGNQGVPSQDELNTGRLMDNHHRSEYVLTYEDKDGDWMLVGDVPWDMFMDSCRRLRIMKSSEADGLASRATKK